jgi:hypothetical protein
MQEYFKSIAIWLLIAFFFGIAIGGYSIYRFNSWQLDQSTKLGNMIHGNEIWDMKKRL